MRTTDWRWVAAGALLALGGCAGPMPEVQTPEMIGRIAGTGSAIEFRTEGEAIDAGEAIGGTLTIADASRMALERSPELQASLARVRRAMAEAKGTRLLPNPVLSVVVRLPVDGGSTAIEAGLAAELVALLQRPTRASAADARLRAASAEALGTALDVLAEVQERFVEIQALDAELEILAQRRELVGRLVRLAQGRVDAGESSRVDLLVVETERLRLEADLMDRRAERREQGIAMARLLGRPSDAGEWKLNAWTGMGMDCLDEKQWLTAALEHRPEVQAKRWELAALGDEAALSGSVFQGLEIGVEAERDEGEWALGPGVSAEVPVFDWGQSRREAAEADQVAARHEMVHVQRRVIEEVRRAIAGVQAARESLEMVNRELIPVLERRLEQTNAAYAAGEVDTIALVSSEQELQEALARKVELEKRLALSWIKLMRAVGGPGAMQNDSNGNE